MAEIFDRKVAAPLGGYYLPMGIASFAKSDTYIVIIGAISVLILSLLMFYYCKVLVSKPYAVLNTLSFLLFAPMILACFHFGGDWGALGVVMVLPVASIVLLFGNEFIEGL